MKSVCQHDRRHPMVRSVAWSIFPYIKQTKKNEACFKQKTKLILKQKRKEEAHDFSREFPHYHMIVTNNNIGSIVKDYYLIRYTNPRQHVKTHYRAIFTLLVRFLLLLTTISKQRVIKRKEDTINIIGSSQQSRVFFFLLHQSASRPSFVTQINKQAYYIQYAVYYKYNHNISLLQNHKISTVQIKPQNQYITNKTTTSVYYK